MSGDFIGQRIDFVELHFLEQTQNQRGGERIARTDRVHNLNRNRRAIQTIVSL